MPLIKILIATFLAAWLVPSAYAEADAGRPSVEIEITEMNFGEVPQGTIIQKSFLVKNTGTATLRIERAELGSTGMKIKVKQEIEPGASESLQITWDTSGFVGEAIGQVLLYLNDPNRSRVSLTLKGQIVATVEIVPQPAFYLSQYVGEETTKSLLLRNNQDRLLQVLKLEGKGTHFTARFAVEEPGKSYQLIVTVRADTQAGRYRESFKVITDDPNNTNIHVEVNVLVKPPVFANPEVMEFGQVSLAALKHNPSLLDLTTQTSVISRQKGVMRITSLESDIPFLATKLEPGEPSDRFQLEVSLNPDTVIMGTFDGHLNLHTDDPEFPLLQIPVTGYVLE
ncbi:MAG TPA: DUF1573 domain-containing protein [Xanthomonadales bacterium]|nr:DUF1573 domain-containing protein [Xanthomonadales bacterium]